MRRLNHPPGSGMNDFNDVLRGSPDAPRSHFWRCDA